MANESVCPDGRPHNVYTISGVRVEFPAKAYPSQIAMMDKVIRGLQRGQHSLLESPTGSGKTLALLCASLAWQRAEADAIRKNNEAIDLAFRASIKQTSVKKEKTTPLKQEVVQEVKSGVKKEETRDLTNHYLSEDDSDDDFQPSKRLKISTSPLLENAPADKQPLEKPPPIGIKSREPEKIDEPLGALTAAEMDAARPMVQQKQRIPKIFFGTRTHKQIAQVVKEFKRTVYCQTPMTVLGSREHTCIHPEVSRSSNKNDGCKALNDRKMQKGAGCSFKRQQAAKLKTQNQLVSYGFRAGWDIEDLVKLGRQTRSCPYYATRDLMEKALIVFCPYNYLIDPRVRQSMKINIANNVIILDEAHNIEDAARESAGGSFSHEDFRLALNDCEKVGPKNETMGPQIKELAEFSSYMMKWIDRQGTSMTSVGIDREVNIMNGTEFVASLSVDGYGQERLKELHAIVDFIFAEQVESEWADKEEDQEPKLNQGTQMVLEGFLIIMGLMLSNNEIHRDDYRAVVVRSVERRRAAPVFGKGTTANLVYSLHLWCLNPAVVLKDVRENTRSIVVTSGTLSPLASYQSELDIDFKLTLEANHVIPARRVWVGSIANGPKNTILNGTFKSTSTFEYQDELGRLVLSVCQTVPHGVLCFLPSYTLLEKLVTRWQSTGLWQHMSHVKTLVSESRNSNDFENTLKEYYEAIHSSERALHCAEMASSGEMADPSSVGGRPSGALMLAVCRGKVSEGLDFSDNNARAVICIGIPFPNVKDTQVELKRAYNDKKSATTPLLNGSEWYEIQAFRALNQALGRCIRHKADWGAILLVDDRFGKVQRYTNQLSKWARTMIRHYHLFAPMMSSLKEFTDSLVAEDAAAYLASRQSIAQQPVLCSPYFARSDVKLESPECVSLSSDEDEDVGDGRTPDQPACKENTPIKTEQVEPEVKPLQESWPSTPQTLTKKMPAPILLGSSNRLTASQQKMAAERGSRYFQSWGSPTTPPS